MNQRRLVPAILALLCLRPLAAPAVEPGVMGQVEATAAGVALGRGEWAEAIEHADRALAIWPGLGDLLVLRGIARYHAGEYRRGLTDLQEALATTTRYRPRALFYAGLAGLALGDEALATRHLMTLLQDHPEGDEARRLQALVHQDPGGSALPPPAVSTAWSGQGSLALYRDDDPRQVVRTGDTGADDGDAGPDLLAVATVGVDFQPGSGAVGLHLEGAWSTYRRDPDLGSTHVAAGLIAQGAPWAGAWAAALATGREERAGSRLFGRGVAAELRLRQETSPMTHLEAVGLLRRIRHAEPWSGLDGPEASGSFKGILDGGLWWCERLSLAVDLDRTIDRRTGSTAAHARWGGAWRIGRSDRILGEFSAAVEHRLGEAEEEVQAPRRLGEATAGLWVPATSRLAWFASVTGQWSGGGPGPDRTLLGTGVLVSW